MIWSDLVRENITFTISVAFNAIEKQGDLHNSKRVDKTLPLDNFGITSLNQGFSVVLACVDNRETRISNKQETVRVCFFLSISKNLIRSLDKGS